MSCPRCNSTEVVQAGNYKELRNRYSENKHRFRCKKCKCSFINRTLDYRKRISYRIRTKIKKLYKQKKMFINKYDGLKKKTYSTREIANMLKLSPSFVHQVVKYDK